MKYCFLLKEDVEQKLSDAKKGIWKRHLGIEDKRLDEIFKGSAEQYEYTILANFLGLYVFQFYQKYNLKFV
ncbi:MAG: hypothetical protein RLZZ414_2021 [Bacteroidota bacterium]